MQRKCLNAEIICGKLTFSTLFIFKNKFNDNQHWDCISAAFNATHKHFAFLIVLKRYCKSKVSAAVLL